MSSVNESSEPESDLKQLNVHNLTRTCLHRTEQGVRTDGGGNLQQERSPQTKSNGSQLLRFGLRWTHAHTLLPAAEPLVGTERAGLEWKFAGRT